MARIAFGREPPDHAVQAILRRSPTLGGSPATGLGRDEKPVAAGPRKIREMPTDLPGPWTGPRPDAGPLSAYEV